ncbi:hypothetical protein CWE21_06870 [Pseudidiomarina aquimaris]|uniref:GGDEF domain-containing protein n=1 Tax=Pseudidiomarina aquimaris TaxID=641841 RepID=A0A432XHZ9_9GAMM|nr:EAL domain-containing protein [Pseudidiomarina aquimaris]RUO48262.1 hypothetical protein CWE21_06870 [Pseudidiomarina aquimaris]
MEKLVHPTHCNDFKQASLGFVCAMLALVPMYLFKDVDWLSGPHLFISAHNVLEIIAIAVAVLIFSVGWNTRTFIKNGNLLVFSCLMLAVAIFDFVHTFSYAGMPSFISPAGPEKAINFWLVARLFSALALLVLAVAPWWRMRMRWDYVLLAGVVVLAVAGSLFMIFFQGQLPSTYIEGQGLTGFKIASEYVLVGLFLLAAMLFSVGLRGPKTTANISALVVSSLLMAASEIFFTLYQEVTDTYNFFGHVYKILAYVFLYRAIFVEAVTRPHLELAEEVATTQKQAEDLAHQARLNESLLELSNIASEHNDARFLAYAVEHARYVVPSAGAALYSVTNDALELLVDSGDANNALDYVDLTKLSRRGNFCANAGEVHVLAVQSKSDEGSQKTIVLLDPGRHFSARDTQTLTVWLESILTWCVRLEQEQQVNLLSLAVEQNPNPIFITDIDARIEYANKAYFASSGYSPEELIGQDPKVTGSGRTPKSVFADLWRNILNGKPWSGELINKHKNGDEVVEMTTVFPLKDRHGNNVKYISFKNDVTKSIENEKKIHQLSFFDQMTGLPNRSSYQANFAALGGEAQTGLSALLYINLDNFKLINDALGIEAGNRVLCIVAERLQRLAQHDCKVYRMSGDVFAMLLENSDIRAAGEWAVKVLNTVRAPMRLGEQHTMVTASIGLVGFANNSTSADEVLQHAEVAMYEAKKKGRNNFQVYSDKLHAGASEQLALLSALNFAMERQEFSLAFQPQVAMKDRRILGVEALLRWHSTELGEVSPGQFIPLAERSGLIGEIDKWVFREAARQARIWQDEGLHEVVISVNLSASRFDEPDLVENLQAIAEEERIAPGTIELELTEAVALQNPEQALITISALREAGFRVALDDFGTGYSSISYLKRFGFDKLKIDKSFIDDLTIENATDVAIVRGIIALAKSLKMATVAEGVETEEQWRSLQELGCDEVQGYIFSRPLRPDQLAELLSHS